MRTLSALASSTRPKPGTVLPGGGKVSLVVSRGKRP
jgi:beta-lactam-binding protein with PASTA domain